MSQRTSNPELRKYMDRKVFINIQANRAVSGVLRGFDIFLNLVVEQAFEELGGGQRKPVGTIMGIRFKEGNLDYQPRQNFVVDIRDQQELAPGLALRYLCEMIKASARPVKQIRKTDKVIRGNSVSSLELVDTAKVWQDRTAPGGLAVGGVQRME